MRTLTVTTAGVDFRFEGGNVRATRNGEAIRQFTTDLAGLMVLAIAYLEISGLRSAGRGSSIASTTSHLCRWVLDIITAFRQQHGSMVPLPYRLYLIPGQATSFGKIRLKRSGLDAADEPFRLEDQFSLSVNGDGNFVVDEASFGKLMHCILIEIGGPIWTDLSPKALAGDRAQKSPGFETSTKLLGAWTGRMRPLVWLFKPFAWLRTAWRLATLRSEAATVRKMVQEAFTNYRADAEAYARQVGEEAGRIADERRQLHEAQEQLGRDRESVADKQRGLDTVQREHTDELRRMREAHQIQLQQAQAATATVEGTVELTSAQLLLWQTRYAALLAERNRLAASLGIPGTPLPEELQHLAPPEA